MTGWLLAAWCWSRPPWPGCRCCCRRRRPRPGSTGSRRWRSGPASLSGVLTVGVGLEQALLATLRSTPEPIRPEVTRLVARLRARWSTEDALRAFADDLDDATGDLVAANLILGARRRGAGLASVLDALAESVAADVRARRQIEADRAKPRATARWVTIITVSVLAFLALTGDYVAPFGTPLGQVILAVLLVPVRRDPGVDAARWPPARALPRFIGAAVRCGGGPVTATGAAGGHRRRGPRRPRGRAAVWRGSCRRTRTCATPWTGCPRPGPAAARDPHRGDRAGCDGAARAVGDAGPARARCGGAPRPRSWRSCASRCPGSTGRSSSTPPLGPGHPAGADRCCSPWPEPPCRSRCPWWRPWGWRR